MKRFLITLFVAGIAALAFSTHSNAQSFQIKKLQCLETEGTFTADAIYLRYKVNDGSTTRYPSDSDFRFVAGTERTDVLYLSANIGSTIKIELWDHDTFDPDDFLGSFTVKLDWPKEETVQIRQQGGTAFYVLTYIIK